MEPSADADIDLSTGGSIRKTIQPWINASADGSVLSADPSTPPRMGVSADPSTPSRMDGWACPAPPAHSPVEIHARTRRIHLRGARATAARRATLAQGRGGCARDGRRGECRQGTDCFAEARTARTLLFARALDERSRARSATTCLGVRRHLPRDGGLSMEERKRC